MKKTLRFDAIPKLNGSCKYTDDYQLEDFLYGDIYFSEIDNGTIKKINFPLDSEEFVIVDHTSILGKNIVPEPEPDQCLFPEKEITYKGQPLFAVAHKEKEKLSKFMQQIQVEYAELPAITSPTIAMNTEDNAFGKPIHINLENEADLSNCYVYEKTYKTPHQEQLYLEPQSMIATFNHTTKTAKIIGSMQCPYFVKETVEMVFGDAAKHVVVETAEGIGGAFGGKEDYPNIISAIAMLLSYYGKKTVKIVFDREKDIQFTTKRHPSQTKIKSWTDKKTKQIQRVEIDYRLDAGAFQTLSPVVLSRGTLHALGGYYTPQAQIHAQLFRSNTPPNGAFRGFGAPQSIFAIESHIQDIADSLQVNAYDFRKKNILTIPKTFPTKQKIKENNLLDCFEDVITQSNYHARFKEVEMWNKNHSKIKKGLGISLGLHGGGYTGNGEKFLNSEIKIEITAAQKVKIYISNVEMGQGAHTTLAKLTAEALKTSIENVRVVNPNTDVSPNSGPTVASRTIYIVGNLLVSLAKDILEKFKVKTVDEISFKKNSFPQIYKKNFKADPTVFFDEKTYEGTAYKDFSWAACIVEVEVDMDTFYVQIKHLWATFDVGKTADLSIAEGQAFGGITQGIGYAISEYFYKEKFGRANDITQYIVPTTVDLPDMSIRFIHTDSSLSKGLGELPMDFPAPAIRNAICHATSLKIFEIPVLPEIIMNSIKGVGNAKTRQKNETKNF